jgi:hypothetical protein
MMDMWERLAFGTTCFVIFSCVVITVVLFFRFILCQHFWDLVDKTELPPAMDTLSRSGETDSFLGPWQIKQMCEKTLVLVLRCSKCGKSKIRKVSG